MKKNTYEENKNLAVKNSKSFIRKTKIYNDKNMNRN